MLQRNDEINISVNAKKLRDWVISSEASNRGTFRDYPLCSGVHRILTIYFGNR